MSGHRRFLPDDRAVGFCAKPVAEFVLVIGQIESVSGQCALARPGSDPFQAKPGDPVCQGDIIETSAGGKAGIRFIDGTALNLSNNARAVLNEFVCDGDTPSARVDISRGTFAFIAGEMAKAGRLRFETPFASIRGRTNAGGIGMLSLASLFFAALEEAQAVTVPQGVDLGIINVKDSQDIIDAINDSQFGIVELKVHGAPGSPDRIIMLDDPTKTVVLRAVGSSVSESTITNSISQMLQYQGEQQDVLRIFAMGQGPTISGPGGSGGPPPPPPPPFVQPINFIPPDPVLPPGGPNGGPNGGGNAPNIFIPPPAPDPPPPPAGPNEINEIFNTTNSPTIDTSTGELPGTISSVSNPPTFVWSGGTLTDAQKSALLAASTPPSAGSTTFTYSIVDSAVDFVAVGETLKVTYQVTFSNGTSQPVTVTVFGTNDVPTIDASTNPGPIAESGGDSHLQDIPQVNGTITVTDKDVNDALALSVLGNASASYNGGAVPVENSVNVAALIASGAITFDPLASDGTQQTVNWHYNPNAADLDWLRQGDTLTLTFTVQVSDGHGVIDTQNLVITITGTNDVPVIDGATNPASIPETAGDSSAQDIPRVDGTISITDQDLGDTLTVTVKGDATALYNGGPLPIENSVDVTALIASGAISFDTAESNGEQVIIGWHYDPAAADLDWLRQGDTLTLTFVAQVDDGHGNVGSQNLVITITGTAESENDVPVIDGATNPNNITEIVGDSHAQDIPKVDGTISITDQDLGDTLTVTVKGDATASYTPSGGSATAVPLEDSVDITALIASGAISFDAASSNGEQVIIGWHYNPAAADLDWLRQGDTLTLTFVAQVDDGQGNVGSQNLVITIIGTNDVPSIDGATNPADIIEIAGDSSAQDIPEVTGTISITDQDLGDTLTVTVKGDATASYTPSGGSATAVPLEDSVDISALIASGAISFDPLVSDGEQQTIQWHYDPAVADLDWLREGDTLTLTFVAQVDDGHGNVGSQNLVITIVGTNDVPTIDTSTNPADILEIAGDSHAQNIPEVTGTISITDQDLGDTLTVTVKGDATASYTPSGGSATAVPLEDSVDISALIASGAISFDPLVSYGEQQTIQWHYDPAVADLDWLRQGDTLTLTFVAQVDDGHGNVGAHNLVITIVGTNDVPTIDGATNPASAIVEVAGDSSAQNIPQTNGTITITDQDLGDTLTVTVKGDATAAYKPSGGVFGSLPAEDSVNVAALIASGAITFDPLVSDGEQQTIGWHYDPAAADLDWLRAGDTLTLTFVAQVDDGQGNVGSQDLVITITGTNDVPAFSGVTNPGPIFEIAGNSSAQDIPQQNGTVAITDQDLGDPLTLSVTGSATALYNGGAVPAAFTGKITALLAQGAISFDSASSNGEQQTIGWHYNPAAADLDWLAEGDTLTITYNARVTDGLATVGTQPLVITIKGTNDAPVIKYTGAYTLDQFSTQDYGAWVEQGNNSNGAVNGNPLTGEFQVAHDPTTAAGNFQIRLTDLDAESDNPDTLTRTFNLAGAGNTAKVEFDYRRDIPSGQSNDQFIVYASINGGAFVQIGQIGATGNGSFVDGSYQHFTFDLSSGSAIQTVALRFSVGDDVDDGDVVYVDNVKLSYTTPTASTQTINYTENSAVGILPPQITDVDNNATVHSATVTITNHQANDLLSVTGALPGGITASSYDAATGVLTLTGTASLANYQDALSHILFSNTSDSPSTVDRSLTITVNDGLADSNTATTTIHVTAVDDLPFATPDNVITNFGTNSAFQIPSWALLTNDTDHDNTLSITNVSGGSGGSSSLGSGFVTFNDTGGSGGSFNYTATGGSLNTAATSVTVTQDTNGALDGTSGDNILIAKAGAVTMNGNGGNDILIGNTGSQIMNGGDGSDTFVFKAIADSTPANFDTIQDFTPGVDHLDFTTIAGTTNLHQMATAGEAVAANSISWFKDGSQTIVYVNTTGAAGHVDMEIHLTGSNINLSGSDILHHT